MKIQTPFLKYATISCLVVLGVSTACKKVKTSNIIIVPNSTRQNTIASDEVTVNDGFDQAIDDAITVLSNPHAVIRDATVDWDSSAGVIIINYDGVAQPDGVKARSGGDSIHLNASGGHIVAPWAMTNATATITFKDRFDITNGVTNGYEINYGSKVVYASTAKIDDTASLSYYGGATITNVHGGLLPNTNSSSDSLVVHVIANNISYVFNDQAAVIKEYSFNVNQTRVFTTTTTGGAVYATTRPGTNLNINGSLAYNVSNWGTNRFGNNYYSIINRYIVQNISNLGLSYNPLAGSKDIEGIAEPIISVYGVTNQGSPQLSGTPYGFSITWDTNGSQVTAVLPYYY